MARAGRGIVSPAKGLAVTDAQLVADVRAVIDEDQSTKAGDVATRQWAVETAAELACRYAPSAPDAVMREAVRRCADWMLGKDTVFTEVSIGERSQAYAPGQWSALRHSGAMAILSPWKVRRAGAI